MSIIAYKIEYLIHLLYYIRSISHSWVYTCVISMVLLKKNVFDRTFKAYNMSNLSIDEIFTCKSQDITLQSRVHISVRKIHLNVCFFKISFCGAHTKQL